MRLLMTILVAVMVIGSVGFMLTEKVSLGDALYFTVVTVATVGYGDITPTNGWSKALAAMLIIVGVGTFASVLSNTVEMMVARREEASRIEKVHMVISIFFTEAGSRLMHLLAPAAADRAKLHKMLAINNDWDDRAFNEAEKQLAGASYALDHEKLDLGELAALLQRERDFLLRLLENPMVFEDERFTDVLWSVFHLTDELACRRDLNDLPPSDRKHLAGDAERVFGPLVLEWLAYVRHLKGRYPYLYSLTARMNPFKPKCSAVVEK